MRSDRADRNMIKRYLFFNLFFLFSPILLNASEVGQNHILFSPEPAEFCGYVLTELPNVTNEPDTLLKPSIADDQSLLQFMDSSAGAFEFGFKNFRGWSALTPDVFDELVLALPEGSRAKAQEAIAQIGLQNFDGASALRGRKPPQKRIASAFIILAEAVGMQPPKQILTRDGFEEFRKAHPTPTDLAPILMNPEIGAFQLASKYFKWTRLTREVFKNLCFALPESRRMKAQEAIANIGLLNSDGSNAKQGKVLAQQRMASALMILAKAVRMEPPEQILTRHGFEEFRRALPTPTNLATTLMDPEIGAFQLASKYFKWTRLTREVFTNFCFALPESRRMKAQEAIADIGLRNSDGSAAKQGQKLAQQRMASALMILAKEVGMQPPEQILTRDGFDKFTKTINKL